jgi:GNAT superfamily N-acetyltransferase
VSDLTIRSCAPGDEDLVLTLLHELAVYEKLEDKFHLTREVIARDFLGSDRTCFCELAFAGAEPVGVMTWYRIYSSFAASRGIFLEDLFVRPAQRGKGYGKALLAHLSAHALAEGRTHVAWTVLDWNKPSIAFYDGIGAEPIKGWINYLLSGEALARLAAS